MKQRFKVSGIGAVNATLGVSIAIFSYPLIAADEPDTANAKGKSRIEYRMLERLRRGGRYYVGIGGGKSVLDSDPGAIGFRVADDTGSGVKSMAGYEVTDHVAVELFGGSLGSSNLVNDSPVSGEINYSIYGISGIFNVEGWQRGFSPLLKLGVNKVSSDSSLAHENNNDWLFYGGLGLEYGFNDSIALRTEYEYFSEDTQLISLSLLTYLGGKKPKSYVVPPPGSASPSPSEDVFLSPVEEVSTPARTPQKKRPTNKVEIIAPDTDGDGINDIEDACENTPVAAKADALGCASFEGVVKGVNFGASNAHLTPAAKKALDEMAVELKNFPDTKIQIEAHTDSQGDPSTNLWLSNSRAQSVIAYLGKQGIKASRLIPIGFGEANPIADNLTKEGRAKNRRVEFQVTQSK